MTTPEAMKMEVIRVKFGRGAGTDKDYYRIVTAYYTIQGDLLAEVDPYEEACKEAEQSA